MITMKRKGFTLIELLAVIVVLAVIAIITTPVILGVIEKSKKESYRNSIYGIMESANIYLANHLTNIGKTKEIAFTCNGINCSNEEGDSLDFKGTVPKSGTFYLNGAGEVTVESVYNGKYYANTVDDKVEITEEDTTLSRAELTNMVKDLQQEVKQLKTQVQQSNQNTSNIATLQTKHESDVTSIWNKVGTEDLSSISNGSISKILINQNKLISDLNTNLNNKANSSDLSKYALASQLNVLNTKLDGKANISHTHDWNNITSKPNSYNSAPRGNIVNYNTSISNPTQLTAPGDGYFFARYMGSYFTMISSSTQLQSGITCPSSSSGGNYCSVYLPVRSGEVVTLWIGAGNLETLSFIYQN